MKARVCARVNVWKTIKYHLPEAVFTILTVWGQSLRLKCKFPTAAHVVWFRVNTGVEELPDTRYLVLHNPLIFFLCALLWNTVCHLLPVARLASHDWLAAAACSVITGIRKILLKYLLISETIASDRSHEMWPHSFHPKEKPNLLLFSTALISTIATFHLVGKNYNEGLYIYCLSYVFYSLYSVLYSRLTSLQFLLYKLLIL